MTTLVDVPARQATEAGGIDSWDSGSVLQFENNLWELGTKKE
jgi:hypothetical protein